MLEHMILTLNTTVPFILLAVLGIFLRRIKLINDNFVSIGNKVVFYVAIPATVFRSISNANLSEVFDARFLTFNVTWFISFFAIVWILAVVLIKDKASIPPFVNSTYRSSLSVVAPPLFALMFGSAHLPGFDPNTYAKAILSISVLLIISYTSASVMFAVHDPNAKKGNSFVLGILKSVAKNPVVIGVVLGILFSIQRTYTGFVLPTFAAITVNMAAGLVMPLAMICVGANLSFRGFDAKFKYVIISSVVKLFVMPIAAVLVAIAFGFTGSDLAIIMILNALPLAVGAYVMQAELGGDTYIGSSVLMLTMTLSAFTMTLYIFLFRVFGIIV